MDEIIAYCGLACHACPIYLSSRSGAVADRRTRLVEIVRACRDKYGVEYQPEDIGGCNGCPAADAQPMSGPEQPGRLFATCLRCPVRSCAREQQVASCAVCPHYPCAMILIFFETEPKARERLDKIKREFRPAAATGATNDGAPDPR
jgi:hypothetical protein